ncbi:homoserine dehydrogenase [Tetragenococcus muriaticus]|uniref:Homoserine dehydrogenase n=2 Tax=Tetragenococcus muriaticus TaxID=64642 RepID=A0A091CCJ7_9ENTE|nr:homoserine dehydrogenase [Tetragenococcus muriaticus]KFN90453.1 homoserine dehydrogenase [Tetragenococcus muriaticus 3MR10-3]KFN90872.1 homoserine dehydrogenase [Tetragenococcus muriaticus PMC-11-5]
MEKEVNIAVLGLGVVASGLIENLTIAKEKIKQQTGVALSITKVMVRSKEKRRAQAEKHQLTFTTEIDEILEDPTIDIVVELIGGVSDAKKWITQSLQQGKHVVTANKDLIAQFGNELTAIAKDHNVSLFYEASVAGGVPILQNLNTNFIADEITGIQGILNGTTNFMLTQMAEQEESYEEALKTAQTAGFAESDPTNDVDGWDAVYKLIILARLALGKNLSLTDIETQGIREITQRDMTYAQEFGYQIKLLAQAEKKAEKVYAAVTPVLIPKTHPLALVRNEMNGVFIESKLIGSSMFYGPGAGASPTAVSVLTDILRIVQGKEKEGPATQMSCSELPKGELAKRDVTNNYFLITNCTVDIETFLAKHQIKPLMIQQRLEKTEAAFITDKLTEEEKCSLKKQLQQISNIKQILNVWED